MDQFESELGDPDQLEEPASPDYDPNAAASDDLPANDLDFDDEQI